MKIIKNIIPEEQAIETVVKDALEYLNESDLDAIEYHIGNADGLLFKLVIEPEVSGSFTTGVITDDSLAYQIVTD